MARQDEWIDYVERMLVDSFVLLRRHPDRERWYLRSGEVCYWPDIVRDQQWEYPDDSEPRQRGLSRRDMALVGRVWINERCLTDFVGDDQDNALDRRRRRAVFGAAIAVRARREGTDGAIWPIVWQKLGGRAFGANSAGQLEAWYDAQLQRLAMIEAFTVADAMGSDG